MNERSTASSPRRRGHRTRGMCRATTLVEVIAGLVILGTVLASVVVCAAGSCISVPRRTGSSASSRRPTGSWTAGPSAASRSTPCLGLAPARCRELKVTARRTADARDPEAAVLGSHVIRVEVWGSEAEVQRQRPIVSLDLLVHDRTSGPAADVGGGGRHEQSARAPRSDPAPAPACPGDRSSTSRLRPAGVQAQPRWERPAVLRHGLGPVAVPRPE